MGEPPTFVTGGTGFIGRTLVRRLLDAGETVHLLGRTTSDLTGLDGAGVKVFQGDVTDRASLDAPLAGCARVFHLAGYARNWAPDPAVYDRVNVEGFRNVAEAALEHGVERMVFTSTCLTFGPSDDRPVDEDTPRRLAEFFTDYERSKHLAEQEGARLVERGLPLVIVNPTRVYGPGKMTEGNSVTRLVDMCMRGRLPFALGRGTELGNYVHVDDVVDGHLKAMAAGRTGEKYILGGENISLDGFFLVLSVVAGSRPPRFHVPASVARLYARMEEWRARAFGSYPFVSRGWIETFLHNWAFSSRKAERELGYAFRGLAEGLEPTCRWLAGGRADLP